MDSMTGYGSHSLVFRDAVISVQARSVNQKGLQVVFRMPQVLAGLEEPGRSLVRAMFRRGRVEVSASVSFPEDAAALPVLDTGAARSYVEAARSLASEPGVSPDLSAGDLLRMPGVMVQRTAEELDGAELEQAGLQCLKSALDSLAESRRAEGGELSSLFREKLSSLSSSAGSLLQGQEERVREKFQRLRQRVDLILADTSVDDDRLLSELAIMADRLDITEEHERLRAHIDASVSLLDSGAPECGRKLGFLFQEMLRELNTMCAKVDDAGVQSSIISMKDVLGGMREQVANVE
jgi:uncharacterized protein (TIGR00255 family)